MTELPRTRQSLLIQLERRSDEAWAEFLAIYEQAIYRVCRSRGLQDADARDVSQEVFAAVHAKLATWDHNAARGSFRAWLLRVARNISIDLIRERARRVCTADDTVAAVALRDAVDDPDRHDPDFDLEYDRTVFERAAERVRAEVRPKTWQAFELTTLQGCSAAEAAERLGMPIGSVYTAKCRVVARIRACVNHGRFTANPGERE